MAISKRTDTEITHNSALLRFRAIWLGPTLVLVVICIISIVSFAVQSQTAHKQEQEAKSVAKKTLQSSINKNLKSIGDVGWRAASLYDPDSSTYESLVTQYLQNINFPATRKGSTFVSFVNSQNQTKTEDSVVSFITPTTTNNAADVTTDDYEGQPIFSIADISNEIETAMVTGKQELSLPFSHEGLIQGQSTYAVLVTPIYSELKTNPAQQDRMNAFKGVVAMPVALNPFLDAVQETSDDFRIIRIVDNNENIIAQSNDNSNNSDGEFETAQAKIQNQKFNFAYNNPQANDNDLATARKSTLVTGIGLGIIVFLLFSMMRISERRARRLAEDAEREISESETRFSALIEQSSDITLVLDSHGKISFASPAVYAQLGYEKNEIIGINILEIVGTLSARKQAIMVLKKLMDNKPVGAFEFDILTKSGERKTFEVVVNDLRDENAIGGIVCNSRDISERKLAEIEVEKAKALYENALSNAPIGVALVHQNGEVFFSNDALREFLGLTTQQQDIFNIRTSIAYEDQAAFKDMWESLEYRGSDRTTKELRFDHPDGRYRWGLISTQSVFDDDVFQYYVVQIEDTTERRSIAERLEYQAIHDPLTGLPNRLLFVDRLEVALLRTKRTGLGVAVLFLDLDRFKVVNDSLGHAAGDRLLEAVSERIKASVRPNDTLARFGGDEFVILCEDISDENQIQEISERLLESINSPIMLLEGEVYVTASIGIARSLSGEDTPETILRDADTAMYRAKDAGRNRSEVFDERTHARAVANLETGNGMFRALNEEEFRVHYQPIISLASGRLSGFEALVYWSHPERGHIGPSEFIPLAEETGIIVPLGLKIFQQACKQLHEWHGFNQQASHLTMSINLSPRQLTEPTFVDEVREILEITGVNPSRIWFEITESALMVDAESTIAMLEQLRNLGVHFEVDDFGTGFSSLSYLKKFPVDALKIDQGFVDGLGQDPEDTAIVTAVVSLSHALGLQVIAEGVETPIQMAELKTLGCEYAQGYLFARPGKGKSWDKAVRSNELFKFAKQDQ